MTPSDERDAQLVVMIRREISIVKHRAIACGWHPSTSAWHRAFGELAGMQRILQYVDPEAHNVDWKL